MNKQVQTSMKELYLWTVVLNQQSKLVREQIRKYHKDFPDRATMYMKEYMEKYLE